MPETKNEPTVSVHGVPKSQYESGAVGGSPSAPAGGFDKKWILWIGLGIIGIIVLFVLFGQGSGTLPTGSGTGTSSDQANIDAELQKLQSEIDQLIANNKQLPPPPPKKKKKGDDSSIHMSPTALSHFNDTHGFAVHQKLG
jgi:hypothetical protein